MNVRAIKTCKLCKPCPTSLGDYSRVHHRSDCVLSCGNRLQVLINWLRTLFVSNIFAFFRLGLRFDSTALKSETNIIGDKIITAIIDNWMPWLLFWTLEFKQNMSFRLSHTLSSAPKKNVEDFVPIIRFYLL